jgi:hypothetical protein
MDKDPSRQKSTWREKLLRGLGRGVIEKIPQDPIRVGVIPFTEGAGYCDGVIMSGMDVVSTNALFPEDPRQIVVLERPSNHSNKTEYIVPGSRLFSDATYIRGEGKDVECWGVTAVLRQDGTTAYTARPKSVANELRGHTDSLTNDSTYVVGCRILSATIGNVSAGHNSLLDGLHDALTTSEDDPAKIAALLDGIQESIHKARASAM